MNQPPDVFECMEAKAREIIEGRFRVRLSSSPSTETEQAAWDVYRKTTVKLLRVVDSGARIADPEAYASTVARHRCADYWLEHNPDWFEIKGRLYRFFGKQPGWERWTSAGLQGWICGHAGWKSRPMASGSRVAALLETPRFIPSRSLPRHEVFQKLDATEWDRVLHGIFTYLDGPARLDEIVSIAGALFDVKGSRDLAFDELSPPPDGTPVWEPPSRPPDTLDRMLVREQIGRVWAELKGMPKPWVISFLLNPPRLKGSPAGRGEIDVFLANGLTTLSEIASLLGFTEAQYTTLSAELRIEAQEDSMSRFAAVWKHLPLDDALIARLMSLDGAQKIVNLRRAAANQLAQVLQRVQPWLI
jgi:hypothetical protein